MNKPRVAGVTATHMTQNSQKTGIDYLFNGRCTSVHFLVVWNKHSLYWGLNALPVHSVENMKGATKKLKNADFREVSGLK